MQTLSRLLSRVYFRALIPALTRWQSWRYRAFARTAALHARGYLPGDERGIIRLFHLTFRNRKSVSRWRWEYLENPSGKTVAVLETDRAGIVGHMGGIPVRFNLQGEIILASQLVDVMIHPAFRAGGNIGRLGTAYIREARDLGVKLVYGFNEGAGARSYRRFLAADLAPVSEWVLEIPGSQAHREPADDDLRVIPVAGFDTGADALWARIEDRYPCAIVRDRRYLDWRYSPRSDRDYTFWQAADRSGRIVAMAVLGAERSDGLILELLADPDDANAIAALLRAATAHFERSGKRRVRAWLSAQGKLRECAQAVRFRAVDSGFYLNLRRLDESLDLAAVRQNLYYTLGDYDVY